MNPDALAAWRALVEKDLKGASFEKALVHETPEGISVLPLYTDAPRIKNAWGTAAALRPRMAVCSPL